MTIYFVDEHIPYDVTYKVYIKDEQGVRLLANNVSYEFLNILLENSTLDILPISQKDFNKISEE